MRLHYNMSRFGVMIFLFCLIFSSASYSYTKNEIIVHFENKEDNTKSGGVSSKEMYFKGMVEAVKRYNLMKGVLCSDVDPEKIIPKIKKIDAESLFVSVYFHLLFEHCEGNIKEQNKIFEDKIVPLLN